MITRAQLNGPLGLSLAAIAAAGVVALMSTPALLGAVFAPRAAALDDAQKLLDEKLDKHKADHDLAKARFAGRSLFFMPPPPPPPPPPPRPPEPERPPEPVKIPPPTSYAGPLTDPQLWGDRVYFKSVGQDKPVSLREGEELDGVKLLAIVSNWEIKLRWKELDWDIKLFEQFRDSSGAASPIVRNSSDAEPQASTLTLPGRSGRSSGRGADGFQKPELPALPPEERKKTADPPA